MIQGSDELKVAVGLQTVTFGGIGRRQTQAPFRGEDYTYFSTAPPTLGT